MANIQIKINNLYPTEEGSYLLVMEDIDSGKKFGILTMKNEAMYITSFSFGKRPPRPSLYELFSDFLVEENYILQEVVLTQYKNNIYYAALICKNCKTNDEKYIDIKATDAIALAYLNNIAIFAEEKVIIECSELYKRMIDKMEDKYKKQSSSINHTMLQHYQSQLQHAIETENYELAAEIKKKLDKINHKFQ